VTNITFDPSPGGSVGAWIIETGFNPWTAGFPMHPLVSVRRKRKKGCKRSKCSKWKGGSCRCGRE